MSAISVQNFSKSYAGKAVLQACSLQVGRGEVYGLIGRNGAGKTTLLRRLIGLSTEGTGTLQVLGHDLATSVPQCKEQVAYVAQGEIFPVTSVIALLNFERALRPHFDDAAIGQWLRHEKIDVKARVDKLSGGQRKRLEVEIALASRPSVMLMDEPFEGIDPVGRADMIERIAAFARSTEATVLLSSHILGDLQQLCTHCGVLQGGSICFDSSLDALRNRYCVVTGTGEMDTPPCPATIISARQTVEDVPQIVWVLCDARSEHLAGLAQQGYRVEYEKTDLTILELMRTLWRDS